LAWRKDTYIYIHIDSKIYLYAGFTLEERGVPCGGRGGRTGVVILEV